MSQAISHLASSEGKKQPCFEDPKNERKFPRQQLTLHSHKTQGNKAPAWNNDRVAQAS